MSHNNDTNCNNNFNLNQTTTPTTTLRRSSRLSSKRKLDENYNSSFSPPSPSRAHTNHDHQAPPLLAPPPVPPRLDLQFFVKTLLPTNKTLVLQANYTDTVGKIHKKIESVTGIKAAEQRLLYKGRQLQWEQTLKDCGVQNDAGLELVGRMRSTLHPLAWRVVNEMVSHIVKCKAKSRGGFVPNMIKSRLNAYMALPGKGGGHVGSVDWKTMMTTTTMTRATTVLTPAATRTVTNVFGDMNVGVGNVNNVIVGGGGGEDYEDEGDEDEEGDDDEDEEEEEEVNVGFRIPSGIVCAGVEGDEYCRIFMEASGPQALVILYLSKEEKERECGEGCIKAFVRYMKDGLSSGRGCRVEVVMEFCNLLKRSAGVEDCLYVHCRSTLGGMIKNVDLVEAEETWEGKSVSVREVFFLLKEVGERLVKDLGLIVGPGENFYRVELFNKDVSDFFAFLQPVLNAVRWRIQGAAALEREDVGMGGKESLGPEVEGLSRLWSELVYWMGKCLGKMEKCLAMKRKKDAAAEVNGSGWWSPYLAILKELHSVSLLYPGREDRFWAMMRQNKVAVCALVVRFAIRANDYSWLLAHLDILDFEARRKLALFMFPEVGEDYDELHEMLIDRSQLLSESYEYISKAEPSSLHSGIFLEFKNEEATGPGVLREWFYLVCQAIFDPQRALFLPCPLDRRRFYPNPASKIDPLCQKYFRFSGRIIALAMMYKIHVGIVLDRVFFLQLAGKELSVEDIRDADPSIYNSCKQILEMDAEFVDSDALGLTFVIETEELGLRKVMELCAGGQDIVVNSKNRELYVKLIVQHHFVKSIADQVSNFSRGFADILRDSELRQSFFNILELEDFDRMLHGSESEISVDDWKAHTDYTDYKKTDPQIAWFWQVIKQFSAEQKKTLLFFWTSVKYLPVEGFRGLASRLTLYKSLETTDHLPSSHTCFYRICIPPYTSKAMMKDRLTMITQEHVGCSFGTW